MKKVVIIQRVLPHYRLKFFEMLQKKLKDSDIKLMLVYGDEEPNTVPKTVHLNRDWSIFVNNKYIELFGIKIVWQPIMHYIKSADIIIVEQANSLIINYYLIICKKILRRKFVLCYWGHGKNFQSNKNYFSTFIKKLFINVPDRWFAYTSSTIEVLKKNNVPEYKMVNVQNTIDFESLEQEIISYDENNIEKDFDVINLKNKSVGIYCGRIVKEKNIDFLIESCVLVKNAIPDFILIIIGQGPDLEYFENNYRELDWIFFEGEKYSSSLAKYLVISNCFLLPSMIGLVAIDSFISQTPLITCDDGTHGPEISYLVNEYNSIITEPNAESYSAAIINYFKNPELQDLLKKGCEECKGLYTTNNMVERFSRGILDSLYNIK